MWQSITELPYLVRSYNSGYSQLEDDGSSFWDHLLSIRRWKLRHSFCLLLVLWLLCAYFLQFFEQRKDLEDRVEFKRSVLERRAKFMEALKWISRHLPVDSVEWSKSIEHLLDWHGRLNDVEEFRPSPAKEFIFNSMTGVSDQTRHFHPLSTSTHLFIISWLPFAIYLYYSTVWRASNWLFAIKKQIFFSLLLCLLLFGAMCAFVEWRKSSEQLWRSFFDWTMFVVNVRSQPASTLPVQALIHFTFWTLILTSYRHFRQWKITYFQKLVIFGSRTFYDCRQIDDGEGHHRRQFIEEFPERSTRLILEEFGRSSLLNRLYLLFFFDYENEMSKLRRRILSGTL